MTLAYSQFVARRIHGGDKARDIMVMGLGGEAGEVVGALHLVERCAAVTEITKKNLDRDRPVDREKLKLELGDVLFYLTALGWIYGMSLQDIIDSNVAKLIARDGANNERWSERT